MGNPLCRTDAHCTPPIPCVLVGECLNGPWAGLECWQGWKACTDGSWDDCRTDADCTAPATCEVVKSCLQGPDTCTAMCLTDADCEAYGGGTCNGDLYCCEGACGLGDPCVDGGFCDTAKCEAPVPFDYAESTTPEDPVVQAPDGSSVTFATVTTPGETTVAKYLETPELPGGFSLLVEPSFVYNIETTAGIESPIEVCVPYDEPEPPMDENSIRLFHEEEGAYVDRTASVDTENNVVCAEVGTLSPFVVAFSEEAEPVWGASSTIGTEDGLASRKLNYAFLVLASVCSVLFLRLRKRV